MLSDKGDRNFSHYETITSDQIKWNGINSCSNGAIFAKDGMKMNKVGNSNFNSIKTTRIQFHNSIGIMYKVIWYSHILLA